MSDEENQGICLNCGNPLKDSDSKFCENCEDIVSDGDFSYFPREDALKKHFLKIKSKINLKNYKLTIFGLFGLLIYIVFNIQYIMYFINFYHYYFVIDPVVVTNVIIICVGIFGSIYLNINSKRASILLVITGIILFCLISEFYSDNVLEVFGVTAQAFEIMKFTYLQFVGILIVFATGIIGLRNK